MTSTVSVNEILEQAIVAEIIEQGSTSVILRQEAEERAIKEAKTLVAAFNVASGLFKGLEDLKNMPHSKFTYGVTEHANHFRVTTNVPVQLRDPKLNQTSNLHLTVQKSGEITAFGNTDYRFEGYDKKYITEEVRAAKNEDATEVLKFVARKAAQNRLVI